ncbi:MAG: glutamine-hydrolyzing GMP synthase, partial [Dehalococcoidia bacterium]|nr:glutamine-hydrolyzing GMP synthase [Dehalococcoidia bacterium]
MTTDNDKATTDSRRILQSGDNEVSSYLGIAKEKSGQQPIAGGQPVSGAEREAIIVIDFGSQYSHLIARRIRELHVYCELLPHDTPWETIAALNPKGFVLSGGPSSVYEEDAPLASSYIYEKRLPVLGICYGMQVLAHQLGGKVVPGQKKEYGHAVLHVGDIDSPLFAGFPPASPVWMSHGDKIESMPPGFKSLAHTENTPVAIMGCDNIFGLQWHPEVAHSQHGTTILRNFVFNICRCHGNWTMGNFITDSVQRIKEQVGQHKVISAISGGVDSSVVSTLIHKAIGDQLTCIFVNNGLLRREEADRTLAVFRNNLRVNVIYVDASDRFLARLNGITDPETKRKAIGSEFIKIFEEEAAKLGQVDFLAQGTLYPDVIESATTTAATSVKIKTHHNVGGLPSHMALKLIEPLRYLFKDEVRQ